MSRNIGLHVGSLCLTLSRKFYRDCADIWLLSSGSRHVGLLIDGNRHRASREKNGGLGGLKLEHGPEGGSLCLTVSRKFYRDCADIWLLSSGSRHVGLLIDGNRHRASREKFGGLGGLKLEHGPEGGSLCLTLSRKFYRDCADIWLLSSGSRHVGLLIDGNRHRASREKFGGLGGLKLEHGPEGGSLCLTLF